jgi:DNA-binding GntR family transcriptional regulator
VSAMTIEDTQALLKQHRSSKKIADKEDMAGWQDANLKFHEIIYEAARNPLRQRSHAHTDLEQGSADGMPLALSGRIKSSYDQHEKIVSALRKTRCGSRLQQYVSGFLHRVPTNLQLRIALE